MRAPVDWHRDDRQARIELRDLLVSWRHDTGLSQARVADLAGMSQPAVGRFETHEPLRIAPARKIAHALGIRLVMYPDGIPGGPYDGDPAMLLFRPDDPAAAFVWDQQHLMSSLGAARRGRGYTQAELAEVLGTTEAALGEFERTRHGLLFGSVQRYCRALDGFLWLGVELAAAPTVEVAA